MLDTFAQVSESRAELQRVTVKQELPVPSQVLSQREQDKLMEAAQLFQVDIAIGTAGGNTVITLQGVSEHVRKVIHRPLATANPLCATGCLYLSC